MHPQLSANLQNYKFLCHSTTVEYAREILSKGYAEQIFATVDADNQFQAGCKLYFQMYDLEDIQEDPCVDEHTGERFEQEWEKHNQVFLPEVDFCLNADLLKIDADDQECIDFFNQLKNVKNNENY